MKLNYTDSEKSILNYLEKNLDFVLKIGIREVAKATYSSTSTIMRLSKKMGYSGFVELVYKLREEKLLEQNEYYKIEFSSQMVFKVNYHDGVLDFLDILKNSKIIIYGEGFSKIVVDYFYMKFIVLGIDCKKIDPTVDTDVLIKNKMSFDSLIVISKSGESEKPYEMIQEFKKRGIDTVSFTGNKESRISKSTKISFTFDDAFKNDHDIYFPNPFFGYCLVGFEELIKEFFKQNKKI